MAEVRYTSVLKNFFPELKEENIEARSVSELLEKINRKYPGISDYILDDKGNIRGHVSLFIGDKALPHEKTDQSLQPNDKVLIYQAISGG